jgi:hypothetical protein
VTGILCIYKVLSGCYPNLLNDATLQYLRMLKNIRGIFMIKLVLGLRLDTASGFPYLSFHKINPEK